MSSGISLVDADLLKDEKMLTLAEHLMAPESPRGIDSDAPYDLNRALVEAAKEINIDWPEFPSMKRIKAEVVSLCSFSMKTNITKLAEQRAFSDLTGS